VIVGWTIIGLCVEAYGFWLLFCEFLPTVLQFSRRVPFMSKFLDMPFLKVVSSPAARQASRCHSKWHACGHCALQRLSKHMCAMPNHTGAGVGERNPPGMTPCCDYLDCPERQRVGRQTDCMWCVNTTDRVTLCRYCVLLLPDNQQDFTYGRPANKHGGCKWAQPVTVTADCIPCSSKCIQVILPRREQPR
jgi:hypothetical protein